MTAYEVKEWSEFALGQLGASAALLGLVFVGISINLEAIIKTSELVNRAGETVVLLGGVLLTSTAVLLPGEPDATAVALLALGLILLIVVAVVQRGAAGVSGSAAHAGTPSAAIALRRVSALGATVLIAVAGGTLLADAGGGLYWWAGAVALSYFGALSGAWVLLIEILR